MANRTVYDTLGVIFSLLSCGSPNLVETLRVKPCNAGMNDRKIEYLTRAKTDI